MKWLCRIEVSDKRATLLFTSELYNDPTLLGSGELSTERAPVWEVAPEALIMSPAAHAIPPKGPNSVTGWSWGCTEIAFVEISVDDGESWQTRAGRAAAPPTPSILVFWGAATNGGSSAYRAPMQS